VAKRTCRNLINFWHHFPSIQPNFLTQFFFNSSGKPILSGHFAVIAVRQLNFLIQSFLNSEPETTVAIFDFAELFAYFEQFCIKIVSSVLLLF
jgi:hypothetical protein